MWNMSPSCLELLLLKCVFAEHYDVADKATFDPSEIKLYPFNRLDIFVRFCQYTVYELMR